MVAHNGLEPDDGKLSCPVLRGRKGGNTLSYPIILMLKKIYKLYLAQPGMIGINMQMPQVSNPNFNYYIKEVVRLPGIDEIIKITHKRGNKIVEETRPKYAWII